MSDQIHRLLGLSVIALVVVSHAFAQLPAKSAIVLLWGVLTAEAIDGDPDE